MTYVDHHDNTHAWTERRRPENVRIAMKVINHFGDEVMRVFSV